jgi:hypothetical protein
MKFDLAHPEYKYRVPQQLAWSDLEGEGIYPVVNVGTNLFRIVVVKNFCVVPENITVAAPKFQFKEGNDFGVSHPVVFIQYCF